MTGKVVLVGAGPGDPGLLTLRGRDWLASADVVLYDALVDTRVLVLAGETAELRLVGRRHGLEVCSQAEVNEMMIGYALDGRVVVRLKGGDPFLFGRGGEEVEACRLAGVDCEVIPGVSSALAVPALAGIPLTHRDYASSVTILTGRSGKGREGREPDWAALAASGSTMVWLMGMLKADYIVEQLLAAGMAAATPAAAVVRGSTAAQASVLCSLEELPGRLRSSDLRPPGVLVIGEVVKLGSEGGSWEKRPLFGRRIVVTRAAKQAASFCSRLEQLGAEAVEYPVIETQPISEGPDIDRLLPLLSSFDLLVLTSVNGVNCFFDLLAAANTDLRELAGVDIAAIGPATAAAIEARGLRVAFQPQRYRAEELADALGDVAGKRVLLATAELAREVLPDTLAERSAVVEILPVYRSVIPRATGRFEELGEVDMVTFASPSALQHFDELNDGRASELLAGKAVAVIGPVTAEALVNKGITPDVLPDEWTTAGMAVAIESYFANQQGLP